MAPESTKGGSMLSSWSWRRRAAMLCIALAIVCSVGVALTLRADNANDAAPPCQASSRHSPVVHSPAPEPTTAARAPQGSGGGGHVQTASEAFRSDALAIARLDHVRLAVEVARLRQESRLDEVTVALAARYPDTYAGAFIERDPYAINIRFCGAVPAAARRLAQTHAVAAVFTADAMGSVRSLNAATRRVTSAVRGLHLDATIANEVESGAVEVTIADGTPVHSLGEAQRAAITSSLLAAGGGFDVRVSFVQGPIDVAQ